MIKSISRKHYTNKNKNVRVFLTLVTNDTAKILKESKILKEPTPTCLGQKAMLLLLLLCIRTIWLQCQICANTKIYK
jgi:hypothetical protein